MILIQQVRHKQQTEAVRVVPQPSGRTVGSVCACESPGDYSSPAELITV